MSKDSTTSSSISLRRTFKTKKKAAEPEVINVLYMDSTEHQPEIGELVIGYSQFYNIYHICHFHPSTGWHGQDGDTVQHISHWFYHEKLFLFPSSNGHLSKEGVSDLKRMFRPKTWIDIESASIYN